MSYYRRSPTKAVRGHCDIIMSNSGMALILALSSAYISNPLHTKGLVRMEGHDPSIPFGHWCLRPVRIPIPTHSHIWRGARDSNPEWIAPTADFESAALPIRLTPHIQHSPNAKYITLTLRLDALELVCVAAPHRASESYIRVKLQLPHYSAAVRVHYRMQFGQTTK